MHDKRYACTFPIVYFEDVTFDSSNLILGYALKF